LSVGRDRRGRPETVVRRRSASASGRPAPGRTATRPERHPPRHHAPRLKADRRADRALPAQLGGGRHGRAPEGRYVVMAEKAGRLRPGPGVPGQPHRRYVWDPTSAGCRGGPGELCRSPRHDSPTAAQFRTPLPDRHRKPGAPLLLKQAREQGRLQGDRPKEQRELATGGAKKAAVRRPRPDRRTTGFFGAGHHDAVEPAGRPGPCAARSVQGGSRTHPGVRVNSHGTGTALGRVAVEISRDRYRNRPIEDQTFEKPEDGRPCSRRLSSTPTAHQGHRPVPVRSPAAAPWPPNPYRT